MGRKRNNELNTELFYAVLRGDPSTVRSLLSQGAKATSEILEIALGSLDSAKQVILQELYKHGADFSELPASLKKSLIWLFIGEMQNPTVTKQYGGLVQTIAILLGRKDTDLIRILDQHRPETLSCLIHEPMRSSLFEGVKSSTERKNLEAYLDQVQALLVAKELEES